MITAAPRQFGEHQIRTANRIMDSLDRWEDRLSDHYSHQRSHSRQQFRKIVTLLIPNQNPENSITFEVFARDISQSGLSFVHPEEFDHFDLLVCLDQAADNPTWLKAKVVRARTVLEGWWEYGLCFYGKAKM